MPIENYIVIVILALVIGGALAYIIKAKKAGKKCIGCPYADSCRQKADCTCHPGTKEEK
jgi:hypothetical protein